jgi:hypothetical protein
VVIASSRHKMVYVRIPKTGSSSVKLWMKPALGCRTVFGGDEIHSPWVPKEMLDWDVFVTIRHPMTRAGSLWHWCTSGLYPEIAGWSFPLFIDWLIEHGAAFSLMTTPPCEQMWFIDQCGAAYRHRMEELDDLPNSWRFRGMSLPPMRHEHKADYQRPDWTRENMARVEALWPRDFEELGY